MNPVDQFISGARGNLDLGGQIAAKSIAETVRLGARQFESLASMAESGAETRRTLSAKSSPPAMLFALGIEREPFAGQCQELLDLAWECSRLGAQSQAWFARITTESLQSASQMMMASFGALAGMARESAGEAAAPDEERRPARPHAPSSRERASPSAAH